MSKTITDSVKEGYGAVAREGLSSNNKNIANIAKEFGYSDEELNSIPAEANMGLSCGNPIAIASIKEGETVVDLGSGGGLDVFLAAEKVGATGRAIGIDMTSDMIELASRNAKKTDLNNVEFHLAQIDAMPLETNSVDCIISNCVINLIEDKLAAFAEIYRVLKPGGRLAISDITLTKPLPDTVKENMGAWVACISGAVLIEENKALLKEAGFADVQIVEANSDLNIYKEGKSSGCCAPIVAKDVGSPKGANQSKDSKFHECATSFLEDINVNDFAASVKIFALKPL